MAPSKVSSTLKPSISLKQGTLGFTSSKRTASSTSAGKTNKLSRARSTPATRTKPILDDSSDEIEEPETQVISSDSEIDVSGGFTPPAQVPKTMAGGSDEKTRDKTTREMRTLRPKDSPEKPKVAGKLREEARPELHEKDPRWERYYEVVRDKMGNVRPIHTEGQSKIHEILRVFDLSYEYGPCVGVSRLERWERAAALGLNPPAEVRDILCTRQGASQTEFSRCVFYEEV